MYWIPIQFISVIVWNRFSTHLPWTDFQKVFIKVVQLLAKGLRISDTLLALLQVFISLLLSYKINTKWSWLFSWSDILLTVCVKCTSVRVLRFWIAYPRPWMASISMSQLFRISLWHQVFVQAIQIRFVALIKGFVLHRALAILSWMSTN